MPEVVGLGLGRRGVWSRQALLSQGSGSGEGEVIERRDFVAAAVYGRIAGERGGEEG